MSEDQPVRVGIGLVRRGDRFLVRRRPEGTIMAGRWEFPGGKCGPGERTASATARECLEELGFEVEVGALRRVTTHRYPHGLVELYYYDCVPCAADAEPNPTSGFTWVRASELCPLDFPEANGPILEALAREFARAEAEESPAPNASRTRRADPKGHFRGP